MSSVERPVTASHEVGSYFQPASGLGKVAAEQTIKTKVFDSEEPRVRQPQDWLGILLAILGIVALLIFTVYAQRTTQGVQEDVRNITAVLAQLLQVPVTLFEFLVTLFVPIAVLTELTIKRMGRQVVESALALVIGLLLAAGATYAVTQWGSDVMIQGLSVRASGQWELSIPGFVAALSGLLTAAGPRTRRRTVSMSWNLLWMTLGILLITVQVSLPGVLIALLIGRVAGLGVRYASGVNSERATGDSLVRGVQRAGFYPIELHRIFENEDEPAPAPSKHGAPTHDATAVALTRYSDTRVYAMTQGDGSRLDVVVLDGDRQVIGILQRLWRSFRVRGLEGRSAISLRAVAERAALLIYAASAAGVRTPALRGVAAAEDSMILVLEHPNNTEPLSEVPRELITDAVMDEAWHQLSLAHQAGLTHRSLSADTLLLTAPSSSAKSAQSTSGESASEQAPQVWISGWQSGDVASATLTRRLDIAQMLTLFGLLVGPQRAFDAAAKAVSDSELAAIGPLLQSVILPAKTRALLRADKSIMTELRAALIEELPEASIEPVPMARVNMKRLGLVILTIIVVGVVFTSLNLSQITEAVSTAQPWWAAASVLLGMITWLGAAIHFVGFSPTKLPLWQTTLVQAAASFVAIAAPAGIGPAALNLRMLNRRGVATSLAVATVALVQVSGFVVTVVILLLLALVSGEGGTLRALPSTTVITAVIVVTSAGIIIASIPVLRRWFWAKVSPTLTQILPRITELLSTPWRLAYGVAGSAILTLGYVLAFDAALRAFGQQVSLIDVAIVYLVGNTIGAMAPTPGGLGAVEVALITGLTTTAAVPAAIATSVVVLFRVATYWVQIPLGWLAMQHLQRKGNL